MTKREQLSWTGNASVCYFICIVWILIAKIAQHFEFCELTKIGMRGADTLIPARFLTLTSHLCVIITLLWESQQSLHHCLPSQFHKDLFQTYHNRWENSVLKIEMIFNYLIKVSYLYFRFNVTENNIRKFVVVLGPSQDRIVVTRLIIKDVFTRSCIHQFRFTNVSLTLRTPDYFIIATYHTMYQCKYRHKLKLVFLSLLLNYYHVSYWVH